jgi:hypothetical protein
VRTHRSHLTTPLASPLLTEPGERTGQSTLPIAEYLPLLAPSSGTMAAAKYTSAAEAALKRSYQGGRLAATVAANKIDIDRGFSVARETFVRNEVAAVSAATEDLGRVPRVRNVLAARLPSSLTGNARPLLPSS